MFVRVHRPLLVLLTLPLLLVATAGTASHASPQGTATDVGGPVAPGTVWTPAGSPYVTTADVEVPAGVTLTIEPGTVVQLGPFHDIVVTGALQAVGTADEQVTLEPTAEDQPWGTVKLLSESGPSEIAYAHFSGGGARREPMLSIATDAALVRDTVFFGSKGVGVTIEDGASPTLRDSLLEQVTVMDAGPPAALQIEGQSDAVVTGNFFQSNIEAVRMDADASPLFEGNRFAYNGLDGVMVAGKVTRDVTWPSLGPRDWPYHVYSSGITVEMSSTLKIVGGATLKFGTAAGIRVRGALVAEGQAANKVLFTADQADPTPGQWREIKFEDESLDYDPATGEGSWLDHAVIDFSGSGRTGAVYIRRSSPRFTNSIIRNSGTVGMTAYGEGAEPELIGVVFDGNRNENDSAGLFVTNHAAPRVSFSIFRNNRYGVNTEIGSNPVLSPHNRFAFNLNFGVYNDDGDVCVDASGSAWSGTSGPQDSSDQEDACGMGANAGDGDMVSDNVNYLPFEGQLPIPALTGPRCGTLLSRQPEVEGLAPPLTDVVIWDNQSQLGRVTTGEGDEGIATFSYTPDPLDTGSHVIQVQAEDGEAASALSDPLEFVIDPDARVDPESVTLSYDLHGTRFVQPYNTVDENGCLSLNNESAWTVRAHPGAPLVLGASFACPGGEAPSAAAEYLGATYRFEDAGEGRQEATFEMGAGGPFAIDVTCGSSTRRLNLGTINIEYEGFVYDLVKGHLHRIPNAEVTLLEYDAGIGNFVRWPAEEHYGQTNPQITGEAGWYAFYPPPGRYIVKVDANDYERFISTEQRITVEPIVLTIGLRTKPELFLPALKNKVR